MLKVNYTTELVVFLRGFECVHAATVEANATQWPVASRQPDAETRFAILGLAGSPGRLAGLDKNMHHHGGAANTVVLARIDVEPANTMEMQAGLISYGSPQLPGRQ